MIYILYFVCRNAGLVCSHSEERRVTGEQDLTTTAPDTDTDNDLDLTANLFPDPSDFPPSSPTFSFPPLPPSPDLEETETLTSSTIIKTAIEVLPTKLETKKKEKEPKSALKNKDQEQKKEKSILKEPRKDKEEITEKKKFKNDFEPKIRSEKKEKYQVLAEKKVKQTNLEKKRQKKELHHQLKVPQVQLQVSSEREIVDSIVVIKTKQEKKEEKLARKTKRRKEKKEAEQHQHQHQHQQEEEECSGCQEEKIRRRRERELVRSDELGNSKHQTLPSPVQSGSAKCISILFHFIKLIHQRYKNPAEMFYCVSSHLRAGGRGGGAQEVCRAGAGQEVSGG